MNTEEMNKHNSTFEEWFAALCSYGMRFEWDCESAGSEAWREFYDAGDSPVEACEKDMSNF